MSSRAGLSSGVASSRGIATRVSRVTQVLQPLNFAKKQELEKGLFPSTCSTREDCVQYPSYLIFPIYEQITNEDATRCDFLRNFVLATEKRFQEVTESGGRLRSLMSEDELILTFYCIARLDFFKSPRFFESFLTALVPELHSLSNVNLVRFIQGTYHALVLFSKRPLDSEPKCSSRNMKILADRHPNLVVSLAELLLGSGRRRSLMEEGLFLDGISGMGMIAHLGSGGSLNLRTQNKIVDIVFENWYPRTVLLTAFPEQLLKFPKAMASCRIRSEALYQNWRNAIFGDENNVNQHVSFLGLSECDRRDDHREVFSSKYRDDDEAQVLSFVHKREREIRELLLGLASWYVKIKHFGKGQETEGDRFEAGSTVTTALELFSAEVSEHGRCRIPEGSSVVPWVSAIGKIYNVTTTIPNTLQIGVLSRLGDVLHRKKDDSEKHEHAWRYERCHLLHLANALGLWVKNFARRPGEPHSKQRVNEVAKVQERLVVNSDGDIVTEEITSTGGFEDNGFHDVLSPCGTTEVLLAACCDSLTELLKAEFRSSSGIERGPSVSTTEGLHELLILLHAGLCVFPKDVEFVGLIVSRLLSMKRSLSSTEIGSSTAFLAIKSSCDWISYLRTTESGEKKLAVMRDLSLLLVEFYPLLKNPVDAIQVLGLCTASLCSPVSPCEDEELNHSLMDLSLRILRDIPLQSSSRTSDVLPQHLQKLGPKQMRIYFKSCLWMSRTCDRSPEVLGQEFARRTLQIHPARPSRSFYVDMLGPYIRGKSHSSVIVTKNVERLRTAFLRALEEGSTPTGMSSSEGNCLFDAKTKELIDKLNGISK